MAAKRRRTAKKPSLPANAPQHEEIRFAKKAQWIIAGSGIAVIFGIYQMASGARPLSTNDTLLVLSAMLIVVLLCFYFLWKQQEHLAAKRRELDPQDANAFGRGFDHIVIYVFAMVAATALLLAVLHRGS